MRCMNRNRQTFWYALYVSDTVQYDTYGNETGEPKRTYSDPVMMCANISPAAGQGGVELFGTFVQYDRTIVTEDLSCPIDENTILYVDNPPTGDYDYIVVGVAKSINSITYAIRKVQTRKVIVSAAETPSGTN